MSIGKIVRWQDDKGFGFVKSDDLDKDIFVHISAFPANSPRPKVGDEVVFQVKNTPKGLQVSRIRYQNNETRTVATSQNSGDYANLKLELERDEQPIIQGRNITNRNNATQNKKYNNRPTKNESGIKGLISSAFGILILGGIGLYAYNDLSNRFVHEKPSNTATQNIAQPTKTTLTNQNFSCDGRTTCGQMNSREEAEWFSKNCPNTTMDGDNDGNVCENDSRW